MFYVYSLKINIFSRKSNLQIIFVHTEIVENYLICSEVNLMIYSEYLSIQMYDLVKEIVMETSSILNLCS